MATILIVDDEFGIAEALDMALTDAGHRVATAINGRQGLQRLAEAKPDLLLLDFMMPVLDGPGMCRAMAEHADYRDIPIVMMSSLPETVVAKACSSYVGFLRKPFSLQSVFAAVARIIGSRP